MQALAFWKTVTDDRVELPVAAVEDVLRGKVWAAQVPPDVLAKLL
jgi:hypothetical protein